MKNKSINQIKVNRITIFISSLFNVCLKLYQNVLYGKYEVITALAIRVRLGTKFGPRLFLPRLAQFFLFPDCWHESNEKHIFSILSHHSHTFNV